MIFNLIHPRGNNLTSTGAVFYILFLQREENRLVSCYLWHVFFGRKKPWFYQESFYSDGIQFSFAVVLKFIIFGWVFAFLVDFWVIDLNLDRKRIFGYPKSNKMDGNFHLYESSFRNNEPCATKWKFLVKM